MKYFFIFLGLVFLSGAAHAQNSAVVFARDVITIAPKKVIVLEQEAPAAAKEGEADTQETPIEPLPRAEHTFTVEIRPAITQTDDGLFFQKPFSDSDGLMKVYDAPTLASLGPAHIYTPLDVLFVRGDGTIVQIAPEITLSSLASAIDYNKPILALLYLKAGICKKLDIHPGDWIKHGLFSRNPDIIQEPTK